MTTDARYEWRRQLVWGVVIIVVGLTLVLDRMDIVELGTVWHYWPLIIVVTGMNKLVGYPSARHFSDGIWTILVGLWMFAVVEGMFGLTWSNSWPLLIIAFGIKLVIEPLVWARFIAGDAAAKPTDYDHESGGKP